MAQENKPSQGSNVIRFATISVDTTFKGPDGPGGGDGMEFRFKAIEDRLQKVEGGLEKVDERLRGVETGIATLSERVAHLPSKGFIINALVVGLALIAGLVAFQGQIQAFMHIAP